MGMKSLKFGDDMLLRRMAIFIRITGNRYNTGYFGVFDGMASGVEMCGYRSAREIGSDRSEMIREACDLKKHICAILTPQTVYNVS